MENTRTLAQVDPEIAALVIREETERQEEGLELIASRTSSAPRCWRRWAPCSPTSTPRATRASATTAAARSWTWPRRSPSTAPSSSSAPSTANVQAHSGSQANMAAYMALMKPGDTMLSLDLNSGGHLTHGAAFNFSGKLYKVVHYGLDRETETHRLRAGAGAGARSTSRKVIVVGASAYPRTLDFAKFREIADERGRGDGGGHGAHRRAGRRRACTPRRCRTRRSSPPPRTRRCAARAAGMVLCKEPFAKAVNSQIFPGIQGGPLMHVIAAKAVAFKEALQPEFKAYQQQIVANAKALAEALQRRGPAAVLGRHRQPPDAGGPAARRSSPARWPRRCWARPASP